MFLNVLLLQNSPCIFDKIEQLVAGYPKSSILYFSGGDLPKGKPPLSEKWVIVIQLVGRNVDKVLKSAKALEDRSHLIFVSSNNSGKPQELLSSSGFIYKVHSNLKQHPDTLVQYVCKHLDVSASCAKHIVSVSGGYEPNLLKNVQTLKLLGEILITRTTVDRYLADNNFKSFYQIYLYTIQRKNGYTDIVKSLYRYVDNISIVNNYIIKQLELDIRLYKAILCGELSLDNYIEYAGNNDLSINATQNVLRLFNLITIEALYARLYLHKSLVDCSAVDFVMKALR